MGIIPLIDSDPMGWFKAYSLRATSSKSSLSHINNHNTITTTTIRIPPTINDDGLAKCKDKTSACDNNSMSNDDNDDGALSYLNKSEVVTIFQSQFPVKYSEAAGIVESLYNWEDNNDRIDFASMMKCEGGVGMYLKDNYCRQYTRQHSGKILYSVRPRHHDYCVGSILYILFELLWVYDLHLSLPAPNLV